VNSVQNSGIAQNLRETYFRIGAAGPDVETRECPEFAACRSPHRHPTCNFAVVSLVQPEVLVEVVRWGEASKPFNVYTYSGLDDPPLDDLMGRFGLRSSTMLLAMSGGVGRRHENIEWTIAEGAAERLAVTTFMAQQFFSVQPAAIRDVVALSTAHSGIPLASANLEGRVVGAVMKNSGPHELGIYNLCVSPNFRGKGIGTQMMEDLIVQAGEAGQTAALQCDRRLASWYERLGLETVGVVDVWYLDR
jgi:GNAT superfamily N-acetyltransferase